ncbi:MAG: ATP-binding protein [Pseudomonadota bacterium]
MDNSTLLRLETYNPWLRDPSLWPSALSARLPAEVVARSVRLTLDPARATLVVGPRQAGKSTLILLRLQREARPPLLLPLDDPLLRDLCLSGAHFAERVRTLGPGFSAFVFDEVQHLEEAGLFLKTLVDLRLGIPIVATGSSAFHLNARTRESLAGRAHRVRLLPLSLAEVSAHAMRAEPAYRAESTERACLDRMLVWGGYPEVWLTEPERERQALLLDLVQAHLLRDASDAHRIQRPEAFRRILRLAATQVGNLVNQAELASIAGVAASTVTEYLAILEESHVLARVPPFLGGMRAEITSTPKLFLLDNGLRNQLHGGFSPFEGRGDRGALLENLVFTELTKAAAPTDEIGFWRTRNGAEVDFVVRADDHLVAVEVKAGALGRPTLPRSCRSFIEAYAPQALLVINHGIEEEHHLDLTAIRFCRPERVARELARAIHRE